MLQIAQKMAGYSLGEADLLRRAMGKKKAEEMQKQRDRFVDGSAANGIDGREAGHVFDLIVEFAGYGFPKAHSTAYAYITYQTAYLKANHPAEYLASVLTIESANHDRLSRYIAHVREKAIEILPPDVNESEQDFGVVEGAIRFGFAGIKNVGAGAIEAILEARRAGGAFTSLFDFAERVDARRVNRRVVEALVKCGAFDASHPGAGVGVGLARPGASSARRRCSAIGRSGRRVSFGGIVGSRAGSRCRSSSTHRNGASASGWPTRRSCSASTSRAIRSARWRRCSRASRIRPRSRRRAAPGREVRAGGLLAGLRETRTKRGQRMAFGQLEDLEGSFELVFFSRCLRGARRSAAHGARRGRAEGGRGPVPLVVQGTLEEGDPPKILVRKVTRLDEAEEKLSASLRLRVQSRDVTRDRLLALEAAARQQHGDCGVFLHIMIPGESETVLGVGGIRGVAATAELCRDVDRLFGRPVAERSL